MSRDVNRRLRRRPFVAEITEEQWACRLIIITSQMCCFSPCSPRPPFPSCTTHYNWRLISCHRAVIEPETKLFAAAPIRLTPAAPQMRWRHTHGDIFPSLFSGTLITTQALCLFSVACSVPRILLLLPALSLLAMKKTRLCLVSVAAPLPTIVP